MKFWTEFDKMTYSCWKSIVPAPSPLLGALGGFGERKRRDLKGRREDKQQIGKEQKPEKISQEQKGKKLESREATPVEIEKVYAIINNLYQQDPQPIDYFELVLHPQSFGHTIENIFHLSFLDKDGLIRIYIGEHGLPLVEPVNQQQREGSGGQQQASRPGDNKQQMIVSMTPREWTDLVNVFGLRGKAPMIVPTVVQEEET